MADTDTAPAVSNPANTGDTKAELNGNLKTEHDRRDDKDPDLQKVDGRNQRPQWQMRASNWPKVLAKRRDEFADLPESSDHSEIRDQVEFYFSTHNLVTDEHLFKEMQGPMNRPVPIKHIHKFKRMRHFQPYSAVVEALCQSDDLIVVDDGEFSGNGNEAVKRREPLVIDIKDIDESNPPSVEDYFFHMKNASNNSLDRSVYAKNFGKSANAGQIALEKFFRPWGSVMVRKRRDEKGFWKGSVFIEFDTDESAKQFLALDPMPKFNGTEIEAMSKKDYAEMKCREKGIKPDWELTDKERAEQRRKQREEGTRRGRRGYEHRGGHRGGQRGGRRDRPDESNDFGRDSRFRSNKRNRSRSPYRHPRGSVDKDDWNARRDRDRQGGYKKEEPKPELDSWGVPVVKDTRTEAEIAKKRKATDDGDVDRAQSPVKKTKIEFKEDE